MRFGMGFGELVLILAIVVLVFGAIRLPGLKQDLHARPPAGSRRARWSRSDWILVGVAAVAGVGAALSLGLHAR